MLTMYLDDVKLHISLLKVDQNEKMNHIIRMQGEIESSLLNIKSNMNFLSESMTILISSSTVQFHKVKFVYIMINKIRMTSYAKLILSITIENHRRIFIYQMLLATASQEIEEKKEPKLYYQNVNR